MSALHASPIGGHSGVEVTYQRIKKIFYWPRMRGSIQQFVAACSVCQQAKSEKVPYPGLLQPLAVPTQAWHTVTSDFIERLPSSAHYNCILVVVDKFSKYHSSNSVIPNSVILLQHLRWLSCLWIIYISCTACQLQLSLI